MPVDMSGDWTLVQTEGLEDYLRSIGTPEEKIKLAASATPTLTIKQTGDNFEVTSGLLKETQSYSIGTPFTSQVNGQDVQSVASWDGDKMVIKTTSGAQPGKEHVTVREIVGGKLVQKLSIVGGPVATRTFSK